MPVRVRHSKRRSAWPAGYGPFEIAIGFSPRRLAQLVPDPKQRRDFERAWRAWDDSLEAAAWRLQVGEAATPDKVRLLNATGGGRRLVSTRARDDEVEAAWTAYADEVDALLGDVEPEPPPELPPRAEPPRAA